MHHDLIDRLPDDMPDDDDDGDESVPIELSGESSSVVASWLGLESGDDSDEDDDLDAEKFVRAPRLGLGAKFIPHKPVAEACAIVLRDRRPYNAALWIDRRTPQRLTRRFDAHSKSISGPQISTRLALEITRMFPMTTSQVTASRTLTSCVLLTEQRVQ